MTSIQSPDQTRTANPIVRRIIQIVIMLLVFAASLFGAAGTFKWGMAWLYLAVYVAMIAVNALLVDRSLIEERSQVGENTKEWDKLLSGLALLLLNPVALIVAGLDERFRWAPHFELYQQLIALGFLMLGQAIVVWAMSANKFFSGTVRIQSDRGHQVITAGPYRLVRHPGYLGFSITAVATPLMLGSAWALIPAGLGIVLVIIRTALEDRTLRDELPGYREYARHVRFRLIPGVW